MPARRACPSSVCLSVDIVLDPPAVVFRIAPAFAEAPICKFAAVHLQFDPNFSVFRTCGCCPACSFSYLRLVRTLCTGCELCFSVPFRSDASRFGNLGFLD